VKVVVRHVSDDLSAYIDGALGVREVERVKAHLDVCPGCQQEYQGLQAVQRLLRGLPDPAPPAGFLDRLHWRLQREASRPAPPRLLSALRETWSIRPFRLAVVAGGLVLVLGLPLAWMSGQFTPRQAPLDADDYVRHHIVFSSDRPLMDEATATFVSADFGIPDQPPR
jgi:anti-sigma factor RsiW